MCLPAFRISSDSNIRNRRFLSLLLHQNRSKPMTPTKNRPKPTVLASKTDETDKNRQKSTFLTSFSSVFLNAGVFSWKTQGCRTSNLFFAQIDSKIKHLKHMLLLSDWIFHTRVCSGKLGVSCLPQSIQICLKQLGNNKYQQLRTKSIYPAETNKLGKFSKLVTIKVLNWVPLRLYTVVVGEGWRGNELFIL